MTHVLTEALREYGYLAVFLLVGVESVGVPLPGEASLILGALLAATGRLSIVGVIAAAALGGILGGTGGYWLGHSGGVALLERYGRVFRVTPTRVRSMQRFFARHGGLTIFFARFVTLLRAWAFILAGTAKMPFGVFTLFNIVGALIWATGYGVLAYIFGNSLLPMAHHISLAALGVAALVAVGGSIYSARHQRAEEAEARVDVGGMADMAMTGAPGADYASRMAAMHAGEAPVANAATLPPPKVDVQGDDVTYGQVGGEALRGYYARPKAAHGRLPGVVMVHEFWGLNDNIRMMARRLAGEGYAVLAVDLYHGQAAVTPDSARALMQSVMAHPDLALQNLHAAITYLRDIQHVTKLGVLGWCFGGGWSLQTALANPDRVDADVVYYGQPELDRTRLSALQAPLLGFFGGADQGIPVDKVRQMQLTLASLNKHVTITVYDHAKHAFANPSGPSYDPKAADDAWQKTLAFLARYLKV